MYIIGIEERSIVTWIPERVRKRLVLRPEGSAQEAQQRAPGQGVKPARKTKRSLRGSNSNFLPL